jgi:hypothetical protein
MRAMMYGTRALAEDIVHDLREWLAGMHAEDLAGIRSVFLYGSFVRGDWLDSNSDLDIGLVLSGPSCAVDASSQQLSTVCQELLGQRPFPSHTPGGLDWCTLPELPKTDADVRQITGFAPLNIFLFDFAACCQVIWGEDFVEGLPQAPEPADLVDGWFARALTRMDDLGESDLGRQKAPLIAGHCIFVAQLLFGERTINKRQMLELYARYVPDFRMKAEGEHLIRQWVGAVYPAHPPQFEEPAHYRKLVASLWELCRSQGSA